MPPTFGDGLKYGGLSSFWMKAIAVTVIVGQFLPMIWVLSLFTGPMILVASAVLAIEAVALFAFHRMRVKRGFLTPIPPRSGTSRSGQGDIEAYFRVRQQLANLNSTNRQRSSQAGPMAGVEAYAESERSKNRGQ